MNTSNLKLHYIQHVPFEDPGHILLWAKQNNFAISSTKLYDNGILPDIESFDWLIVMGGPMNIYEYDKYPWLKDEQEFITAAINSGRKVIGICLGAQHIAHCLGAKVFKGEKKEIGWFDIDIRSSAHFLLNGIPSSMTAFHWHGDTFSIPENCESLASSPACKNQMFIYDDRVIAMQFHIESTDESINALVSNCKDELVTGEYIMTENEINSGKRNIYPMNKILELLLYNLLKKIT